MIVSKKRIWRLLDCSEQALRFAYRQGCEIDVEHDTDTQWIDSHRSVQYTRNIQVTLTTDCEKIDTMLQLKFADKLILMSEEINLL